MAVPEASQSAHPTEIEPELCAEALQSPVEANSGLHFHEQRSPFSEKYEKIPEKSEKMLIFQAFMPFLPTSGEQRSSFSHDSRSIYDLAK